MAQYIVKCKKTYLKSTLSTTATSVVLKELVDSKDNAVTMASFGAFGVIVIKQGDSIEMIKFTGISTAADGTATLTVASSGRNLNPTTPYAGSSTGNAYQAGAEVIVTNDPYTVSQFGNINNAQTWALLQTFTVMPKSSDVPTEADDLINKTYADALVLGSLTTLNVVVPATAGEVIAAGNLVYYDTTDKEWKLCDADTAATVENVLLAIAQGAGTDGVSITGGVLLHGLDSNQSGLTAGDVLYASNTAGAIANVAGTVEVTVGIAKSATSVYFNSRFNQQLTEDNQDALAGNLGTPSSTNKYVTQTGLQKGAEIYAADAGASDTYVITLSPVPTAYFTGMVVHFKANTANTGAATLNVNSLGAVTIKKSHDQDLATGDIESGQIVTVVYDGTNFQMQSQKSSTASLTYTNGVTTKNLADASGDQVIAHGLGAIPSKVRMSVRYSSGSSYIYLCDGTYNGTTQRYSLLYTSGTTGVGSGTGSGLILAFNGSPSDQQVAVISVDATNITLTWTKTGTPTGTIYIMWEAEAFIG